MLESELAISCSELEERESYLKIIVFGGEGQFAKSMIAVSDRETVLEVIPSSIADVRNPDEIERIVRKNSPDFIVSVAAVHSKPDLAMYPGLAYEVNSLGARNVAACSHKSKIPFTYVSTDFVFSGRNSGGKLTEKDHPDASLDTYAETKILGEHYALDKGYETSIWRISSPFGPFDSRSKGPNFLNDVLRRLSNLETVKIVDNIFMSPTYTIDSASMLIKLLSSGNSAGIFHGSNAGRVSWFTFASYASELLDLKMPTACKADANRDTSLSTLKLEMSLGLKVRDWKSALESFLLKEEFK